MRKIPDPLEMPRHLATLHAYVQGVVCCNYGSVRDMLADGKWPCPLCDGRGKIYDPDDPPCIIEGDKMRNRITCPRCCGSGRGEHDWWEQRWQTERAENMAKVSAFESVRAVMRQALAKLTAEEAAALGWLKDDPR